ncbi:hypothetical protein GOP47_0001590 [Adiantum capillus-veneris]|uniref:Rhodanese domain-containing protein n=1 Tax=Adiantum capillus-veneris TaxID=13818 RepID=A0A9D4ZQ95_ADICA|nr:hypothetical protein GOP47_0001590 [Adiantum capillus-veneris]
MCNTYYYYYWQPPSDVKALHIKFKTISTAPPPPQVRKGSAAEVAQLRNAASLRGERPLRLLCAPCSSVRQLARTPFWSDCRVARQSLDPIPPSSRPLRSLMATRGFVGRSSISRREGRLMAARVLFSQISRSFSTFNRASPTHPPPHPLSRALINHNFSTKLSPAARSCLRWKCRSYTFARLSGDSRTDPVVSTEWLNRRLADVCILDVRGTVQTRVVEPGVEKSDYMAFYDDYLEGHIPGAVFFNWVKDGVVHDSDIPVQLTTDTEEFSSLMEAKGVSTEKSVVVYDSGDGLLAPRVWWALVTHGHPSVFVLDGGWKKWIEEDREMEITAPCPLKIYTKFEPRKGDFIPWITSREVLDLILEEQAHGAGTPGEPNVRIIDARSQEQYTGFVRRSKHGGRIPGAINIHRKILLQPSGLHKSLEEQRKAFLNAGLNPEKETRLIAYCNGGVASCTILLAWFRVGGLGTWANYDGSWNEWGNSDDLPKEL